MSNSYEIRKLAARASPKVKEYIKQVACHYTKDPDLYSHTTDSDLVGEALVIDRVLGGCSEKHCNGDNPPWYFHQTLT